MDEGIRDEAFENGCEGAFWLVDAAYVQRAEAEKRFRALMDDPNSNCVERLAAEREAAVPAPLWKRICGLDPTVANEYRPVERRAGLRNLMRAYERMYRAELRLKGAAPREVAPDAPAPVADALIPGASRIGEFTEPMVLPGSDGTDLASHRYSDGTQSFAGRSNLFDPMPEICAYLEISERKLSQLCREQTGLRIYEVGDCIRVEKLNAHLRETFRGLAGEWLNSLDEKMEERLRGNSREAAWLFIRWMRGCGRGVTRKKLGWQLGIPTAARLGRAAFVALGETLEEMEVKVAMSVLRQIQGLKEMDARAAAREQGACSSDVPPTTRKNPFEEEDEREEGD